MSWGIREGDCVEQMREMDEASVDAIVCDPPYGLEFMGKEWDRLGLSEGGVLTGQTRTGAGRGESLDPDCAPLAESKYWAGRGNLHGGTHQGRGFFTGPKPRYGRDAEAMQEWHHTWATEALRVLKPGGHLLAFGGTRTYHRLACAIEDAGFEIRDSILSIGGGGAAESSGYLAWLYGSG